MYRKQARQITIYSFVTPFGGMLNKDNRWVRYAEAIPWDEIEKIYASKFSNRGAPAKPLRKVLGAYILKEEYNFSEARIIREINENPYLQYFIGLNEYTDKVPVSASLIRSFSKRFTEQDKTEIERLLKEARKSLR
ncbi:MAG TPA: transposase [Clostridia bacterium]|mgnify:FL=1|nr:transposase [Clostridia bacterium]HPL07360.1 transposase [Clostridia bacterium]